MYEVLDWIANVANITAMVIVIILALIGIFILMSRIYFKYRKWKMKKRGYILYE